MTVQINLPDTTYDIIIDKLLKITIDKKVVVVTNPTIADLHLDYLLSKLDIKNLSIVKIPDGEQYKTLSTIEDILEHCFEHKLNRSSVLIAFGGGVIGDMTGFTASLYQRGIDFIQIPTTLLSQVDASVGGKTGVNNKFGKNLIGAFHQPKAVYIDPYFLTTLASREFGAGVAEIVKMAVTFNKDFFEFLEHADLKNAEVLQEAIKQAVKTKADVVAQDEKEHGIRAALNYGHTFGHVIENETKYKKYLHGEAVAIGMVMANKTAVEMNLMDEDESNRVEKLLKKYDLPITYKINNSASFYETFFLDKKSSDDKITFIIPVGIGGVKITDEINRDMVMNVLNKFENI